MIKSAESIWQMIFNWAGFIPVSVEKNPFHTHLPLINGSKAFMTRKTFQSRDLELFIPEPKLIAGVRQNNDGLTVYRIAVEKEGDFNIHFGRFFQPAKLIDESGLEIPADIGKNAATLKLDGRQIYTLVGEKLPRLLPETVIDTGKIAPRSFACYLGKEKIEQLQRFHLLFLNGDHYSRDVISELVRESLVCGRILLTADLTHQSEFDWYMDKNGDNLPDRDGRWGLYKVDPSKPGWIKKLSREAETLLKEKGFTGIYLDNLGHDLPEKSQNELLHWMTLLRQKYPDAYFCLNAKGEFLARAAPLLDGAVIEGFSVHYDAERQTALAWSRMEKKVINQMISTLTELNKTHGLTIFTLDHTSRRQYALQTTAIKRARSYGFIPYVTDAKMTWINSKCATVKK